jgi:hypothetical protein
LFCVVIPNVLLSSAYPGAKDPDEHRGITRTIYDCGIELFVNLMRPKDLITFTPYEPEMREYTTEGLSIVAFQFKSNLLCFYVNRWTKG